MSLLEVDDLTIRFGEVAVVQSVSFAIDSGERFGVIGESGSGKTMTALAAIGLAPETARVTGSVRLGGRELLGLADHEIAPLRGSQIAMIFQNSLAALNPLMRVGRQIAEPLELHDRLDRRTAHRAAVELCERVGLPDPARTARAYPHQLSGGQRQRVGLAMALACRPGLLIADEPTSALDVTVQAEVIGLLRDLVAEDGAALWFITHDLAVVSALCDRLAVMRAGEVVETGATTALIRRPQAEYTRELFAAARSTELTMLRGES